MEKKKKEKIVKSKMKKIMKNETKKIVKTKRKRIRNKMKKIVKIEKEKQKTRNKIICNKTINWKSSFTSRPLRLHTSPLLPL